jgi:hypothetical protein
MDTERKRELWDRLDNEPERAHRAFRTFLSLPSDDRTVVEAYRGHVGNLRAVKPSDTWVRWSRDFAWAERASAYDDHLEGMRRQAFERGIVEEAERQGALAERTRNRFNELITLGYEESMRWFEEVGASGMRASDAIQIIRLHMDYMKAFEVDQQSKDEDDWTEEDDAEFDALLKEIDPQADLEAQDDEKIDGEDSDDATREPD